ncbi:unnamed protein product [Sphagnum balticum]
MTVPKVEKAIAKEACKAKKLAKLVAMVELGFAKKLPKTPKGEKEKTFGPFNLGNGERWASIKKESSKGEASKDTIQVVEQVQSSFDSSYSNEEEEENLGHVNILKKPINVSKWA